MLRAALVSLKTPDQLSETNAPFLPVAAADVRVRRARPTTSTSCRSTAATEPLALVKPGRDAEPVRRPREPGRRADHLAGRRGGRSSAPGRSRRRGRTSSTSGTMIDFPRLLFNTVAIAVIGMIGTIVSCTLVAYGFARFRFPGRIAAVHAADRDDLPAVGGHARPDLHDLREDRLGGDVAAAARARRSSPTRSTCS